MPESDAGGLPPRASQSTNQPISQLSSTELIADLESRGISFEQLAEAVDQPAADPFDLLIHMAFNAPLRSRRERAEAVRREQGEFLEGYGPQAREVLDYLLDKYTDHGVAQLTDLHILELPDVPVQDTVLEIADMFGGVEELRRAAAKPPGSTARSLTRPDPAGFPEPAGSMLPQCIP